MDLKHLDISGISKAASRNNFALQTGQSDGSKASAAQVPKYEFKDSNSGLEDAKLYKSALDENIEYRYSEAEDVMTADDGQEFQAKLVEILPKSRRPDFQWIKKEIGCDIAIHKQIRIENVKCVHDYVIVSESEQKLVIALLTEKPQALAQASALTKDQLLSLAAAAEALSEEQLLFHEFELSADTVFVLSNLRVILVVNQLPVLSNDSSSPISQDECEDIIIAKIISYIRQSTKQVQMLKKLKPEMSFEDLTACISKFYQAEGAQSSLLGVTMKEFTDLGEIKDSEKVGISQLDEINELAFTDRDCSQLSRISREFMVNNSNKRIRKVPDDAVD